jgi:hypothetical protein
MADIAQTLATGGTALVSAAAGAGLTYWIGTLNRRHQEDREDATRWYTVRFQAYSELSRAMFNGALASLQEDRNRDDALEASRSLSAAVGQIRLVGSAEVVEAAERLLGTTMVWMNGNQHDPEALHLRATLKRSRPLLAKTWPP